MGVTNIADGYFGYTGIGNNSLLTIYFLLVSLIMLLKIKLKRLNIN